MPRILGIDYGERRIGLAVSDPGGVIAQPLPTLQRRRGKRPPVAAVAELVRAHDVGAIVLGLPLTPAGEESDWTREVRAFGTRLHERTGLAVHYVDERMTSARAERTVRGLGLKRSERERKERVDAAAAILILQAFLDKQSRD
ncbi:MAG: Holliday junction resolvase RuvX [Gemmatimonadetes bacterium]|nr:Holliday junction resolvase RuvX [Gemmatimonadota bacterium]